MSIKAIEDMKYLISIKQSVVDKAVNIGIDMTYTIKDIKELEIRLKALEGAKNG